jgi:hypothetical protein
MSFPSQAAGRRTAYAAAVAARQRRQLIFVCSLVVLLIGLLAWEIPHLHLFGGHKSATLIPTVPTPTPAAPAQQKTLAKLRKVAPKDVFAASVSGGGGSTVRDVPTPAGSVDPFARPAPTGSSAAVTSPLPEQIVIGSPGANRTQSHGWIVILASIPTGEGRAAAATFAEKVQRSGFNGASILNSSNRRPLRGGYWVVYLGPYQAIGAASSASASVHARGYPTAYLRELIVYK